MYQTWIDGTYMYHTGLGTWDDGTSLYHYGVQGMHWGVRRFQNPDGSLTAQGKARGGYPLNGRPLAGPVSDKTTKKFGRKKSVDQAKPKEQKERKSLSEGAKKALKVAGTAAVVGAAGYAAYKGSKALKGMSAEDKAVLLENLGDAKAGAKNALKNAGEGAKNAVKNAKQNVKQGVENAKQNVQNKVAGAKEKLEAKASEKAEKNWNEALDKATGQYQRKLDDAKAKAKEAKDAMKRMDKEYEKMKADVRAKDANGPKDYLGRGANEQLLDKYYGSGRDKARQHAEFWDKEVKAANNALKNLKGNNRALAALKEEYLHDNSGGVGKAVKAIMFGVKDKKVNELVQRQAKRKSA